MRDSSLNIPSLATCCMLAASAWASVDDEPIARPEPAPLAFGEGGFPLTYAPAAVSSIIAADFDGDTHLDLAWISDPPGFDDADYGLRVTIARGFGDGRFVEVLVLDQPGRELLSADFDQDGRVDLAVADEQVVIRYNTGPFEFGPPQPTGLAAGQTSTFGLALTAIQLDSDPAPDLLITDAGGRLTAALNTPEGFVPIENSNTIGALGRPQVTDLDQDGLVDLLQSVGTNSLEIRRGDGLGGFAPPEVSLDGFSRFFVRPAPGSDGWLIAAATAAADTTSIFESDPALGVIEPPIAVLNAPADSRQPQLLDLDADGQLDLVRGNTIVHQALRTQGSRRTSVSPVPLTPLQLTSDFEANFAPNLLLVDVNHDHAPDRITPGYVRLSTRDAQLLPRHGHPEISPTLTKHSHITAADFDQDGYLDLVASGFDQLEIRYGQPTGPLGLDSPFGDPIALPINFTDDVPDFSGFITLITDLDNDGRVDIVALDRSPRVVFIISLANRVFAPIETFELSDRETDSTDLAGIAVSDLDGDNDPDFVVLDDDHDQLHTIFTVGLQFIQGPTLQLPDSGYTTVALLDFDGDSVKDAIIGDATNERLLFACGHPDGSFDLIGPIFLPTEAYWIQAADVNSDGLDDLVVTTRNPNGGPSPILIWEREPSGVLGFIPTQIDTTAPALETTTADLNADGYNDLVTVEATTTSGSIRVYNGNPTTPGFPALPRFATTLAAIEQVFPAGILARDINNDEAVDLLWSSNSLAFGYALQGVPAYGPCRADLNADGIIDLGDVNVFVQLFLVSHPACDFNRDTIVDLADIADFVNRFLAGC